MSRWFRHAFPIALVCASSAGAQGYPFSQRTAVTQNVALTEIELRYGRPVARGRRLFGDSALLPWNQVWHPGADSASRITFSRDVLINDQPVKAGAYSLWLIPRANGRWTFILNARAHVFHTPYPGESTDALRLDVETERGAHMETMAVYFPVVLRDEAVMRIHWGETIVPVRIKAPWRPD